MDRKASVAGENGQLTHRELNKEIRAFGSDGRQDWGLRALARNE
jgi:hypothetical protein